MIGAGGGGCAPFCFCMIGGVLPQLPECRYFLYVTMWSAFSSMKVAIRKQHCRIEMAEVKIGAHI